MRVIKRTTKAVLTVVGVVAVMAVSAAGAGAVPSGPAMCVAGDGSAAFIPCD